MALVLAIGYGTNHVFDNLVSKHVLYVPECSCNLISISAIVELNECMVIFYFKRAILWDTHHQMMIGKAAQSKGLFVLKESNRVSLSADERGDIL